MTHAAHPPECPHHACHTRRDRLRRPSTCCARGTLSGSARSSEPSGTVAQRYGISAETVRKWRKRGASDCLDRSARPHQLPWKATDEERAIVCTLRQATNFPLDHLTVVVCHFLPHLNRDSVWRILKAEGLNRRPKPAAGRPAKGQGSFHDYDLGVVHIDIKHLPKRQTSDGERRKRYLFVAIDRCSRSVHLAVKDDDTEHSAIAGRRRPARQCARTCRMPGCAWCRASRRSPKLGNWKRGRCEAGLREQLGRDTVVLTLVFRPWDRSAPGGDIRNGRAASRPCLGPSFERKALRLAHNAAIVTGTGGGSGEGTARCFQEEGAKCVQAQDRLRAGARPVPCRGAAQPAVAREAAADRSPDHRMALADGLAGPSGRGREPARPRS